MVILNGNKLSKEILMNVAKEIKEKHLQLKLAVVLVGNSLISYSYINKKKEACAMTGVDFELFNFPPDIDESELKKEIKKIADNKNVSGVVIQLPLPSRFDVPGILNLIPSSKDIDVLSDDNFNKFSENNLPIFPPVVGAIKYLFERYRISVKNKKIILIGKGRLVGKPLSVWFKKNKVDFFFVDKANNNISDLIKKSDIVISGTGCAGLVKEYMIKKGSILVDMGVSSEEGKIKGDIDPLAFQKASYVAPVPGGVGPLTIASLIDNLVKLSQKT